MFNRLLIWTVLVIFFYSCNTTIKSKLEESKTYLVFRDLNNKNNALIKKYNIGSNDVSHVGFLIYNHGDWFVYHFIDSRQNGLKVETLDDFIKNRKITINIFEIKSLNSSDLLSHLEEENLRNTKYDYKYSIDNQQLYCSEFIVYVLSKNDESRFQFTPSKRALSTIGISLFKTDTLLYYPVDLFFYNSNFIKVLDFKTYD